MKTNGIIGVIIITFIIIFVASITYSHVESIREQQNKKKDFYIEGYLKNITKNDTIISQDNSSHFIWQTILSDNKSSKQNLQYLMIFKETYPPQAGLRLRFYYSKITSNNNEILVISDIENLSQM